MPTLILHDRDQAMVLEYALSTAADNERDKAEEGVGSEATSALEACCSSLRAVLAEPMSGDVPIALDLLSWAVTSRYLASIEGGWESVEGLSSDAFEHARCSLVATFSRWDSVVVPVVPVVSAPPLSDRPAQFLGWLVRRNADGTIGIFAPPPKPGESQRTSDCIGPGQRDLHELLGKLADHMAALAEPQEAYNGGKTGWPPGLLQDDCRGLSKWLASRPEARQRLREALAQPQCKGDPGECEFNGGCMYACAKPALAEQQEPVAWMTHGKDLLPLFHKTKAGAEAWGAEPRPLYAAPPQRKPLTDEEIWQCFADAGITIKGHHWVNAVRNVERAHGIGGEA